jgi:hypothetical protein
MHWGVAVVNENNVPPFIAKILKSHLSFLWLRPRPLFAGYHLLILLFIRKPDTHADFTKFHSQIFYI